MGLDVDAIQTGVEAAIDGDAVLPGLIGLRRYFSEAPDDAVWPFVVYILVSEVPFRQFAARDGEQIRVRFSMYSKSHNPAEVNAISVALDDVFERGTVAVVGYNFMASLRLGGEPGRENRAYHYWQDYMIWLHQVA